MRGLLAVLLGLALFSGGCVVRVYKKEVPRTDIEVSGNQGYLVGSPDSQPKVVKKTRQIVVTEIEFGTRPQEDTLDVQEDAAPAQEQQIAGPVSDVDEGLEADAVAYDEGGVEDEEVIVENEPVVEPAAPEFQEYTVKQGDTLQKISFKFYGKYSFWKKIYEANKDVLKGPDSLSVGQVLKVPVLDNE